MVSQSWSRSEADLSPNQLAKRDDIVASTVELLLYNGVNGCTVRSIAAHAGVSKGLIHYYFRDVEEVVDLAMLKATQAWIALLPRIDEQPREGMDGNPAELASHRAEALWHALWASLEPFVHGDRTLMPLWLEYWASCSRAGRIAPLREIQGLLLDYVRDILEAAGVEDSEGKSFAVTSYLFGAAMQQSVMTIPPDLVRTHIASLCGIDLSEFSAPE
jgi:AcrR family transcriptional regulator